MKSGQLRSVVQKKGKLVSEVKSVILLNEEVKKDCSVFNNTIFLTVLFYSCVKRVLLQI